MMSGIRGKNTAPEILIRKSLFSRGYRYRLNLRNLPGSPDIVLPKYHAVIFVHGCFWHGHRCPFFRIPATRSEFWNKKIEDNRKRDHNSEMELLNSGWRVCTIWECAIKGKTRLSRLPELIDTVENWLRTGEQRIEFSGYLTDETGVFHPVPDDGRLAAEEPNRPTTFR